MSEEKQIPKHVGIIMDGNRRWATERGLPTLEGHTQGYMKMKTIPGYFFAEGVEVVSVYAFSTENWKRTEKEVSYLMKLLTQAFTEDLEEFHKEGYRLLISGRIEDLPNDLPNICKNAMEKTKENTRGIFNICLNYGGRPEIIDAIKQILKETEINEEIIQKHLYHGELPDPDIIVRTSGEQRLSGFLLWESAYSELLFLEKYWPDFNEEDVQAVLQEYAKRKRRFGGN
ncbi:MAG: polyprenyl diphosphate synthase [Candidatus Magasanikbacteria bacterium]